MSITCDATKIINELCQRICNYHANNSQASVSSNTQQSNELSDDGYVDIEELKLGEETNSEATQSLQDSIFLVTSKFQDFMNKNKTGSHSLSLAKESCVSGEFANYVNDDCVGVDNSIVIQESTTPLTNNRGVTEQQRINQSKCKDYNDLPKELDGNVYVRPLEKNSNCDTSTDVPMTDQTDAKVYCPNYADIVANFSTVTQTHVNSTKNNPNEETVSPLQISDGEACQLAPTVLLACSVNMAKLKNFLTGIAKSVNESQILSYLNQRNVITPTYISIFQSQFFKMHRPLQIGKAIF